MITALLSAIVAGNAALHSPVAFEKNLGQFETSIRYVARTERYTLAVKDGGAVVAMPAQRVRLDLAGARRDAPFEELNRLPGVTNYLTGLARTTVRNVPQWQSVRQRGVLPGIDVVYRSRGDSVETDFVIAPRADAHAIRLRVSGATMNIDENGALRAGEELLLAPPIAYQGTAVVSVRYRIDGGDVTLVLGDYDSDCELVIDPLIYATHVGGGRRDEAVAIAVDASGSAYITGRSNSDDFSRGNPFTSDAFVVKMTPAGDAIVYRTYIGGSAEDYPRAIAVDSAGRAYVTGYTFSTDFSLRGEARGFAGSSDAFLTKLSADGSSILYSTCLGGPRYDYGFGVAVNDRGIAWIGGTAYPGFPTTANAFQRDVTPTTDWGDGFLAAFDTTRTGALSLTYSTLLGGGNIDGVAAIALDATGAVYAVGTTSSTNFPTVNAHQRFNGGGNDMFLAKLAPAGDRLLYSTYLGGPNSDAALAVAVDAGFRAHVAGITSGGFPLRNARQTVYGGEANDGLVAKFDAAGNLIYATYHGGNGDDAARAIALTASGDAIVAGSTTSSNLPMVLAVQPTFRGRGACTYLPGVSGPCSDAFVSSLSADGATLRFSTYLGGSAGDAATGVAADASGAAYVTGYTNSPGSDPFPTLNAMRSTAVGFDAFVVKMTGGPVAPPPNLIADALEVTQAVQTLNHDILLVAGKRTFVRFHVHSSSDTWATTARLTVTNGSRTTSLTPINPGGFIVVRPSPDRAVVDHAFLFELPTWATDGTPTLTAEINPVIGSVRGRNPIESLFADNSLAFAPVFATASRFDINTVRYRYEMSGSVFMAPPDDVDKMESWLRRAYPIDVLNALRGTYDWPLGVFGPPACGIVDLQLFLMWAVDHINPTLPLGMRYYGMVDDGGAFMRGCSFPGPVASGPAGNAAATFPAELDPDGRYADWYGAHELGHAYGRFHIASPAGEPWPARTVHPNGAISETTTGPSAVFGFDAGRLAVIPPTASDVMTYSPIQWISDYTTFGLHPPQIGFVRRPREPQVASLMQITNALPDPKFESKPSFVVTGVIDGSGKNVQLLPLTTVSRAPDIEPLMKSKHAIVLKGADGQILGRFPVTPKQLSYGQIPAGMPDVQPHSAVIAEFVPRLDDATEVAVEIEGAIAGSIHAGVHPPSVSIAAPKGGEQFAGNSMTVKWKGVDVDGDRLTYHVLYSADGTTFTAVRSFVMDNFLTLDPSQLEGSDNARLRILASDGIHTTQADSAPFAVARTRPDVRIISPESGATFVAGQTVHLEAMARAAGKPLPPQALRWSSDRQGDLGTGTAISTAALTAGRHLLTLSANDGQKPGASTSITINVVDFGKASIANALVAAPNILVLGGTIDRASIAFDNRNAIPKDPDNATPTVLVWKLATPTPPWLTISRESGLTPDAAMVMLSAAAPPPVGTIAELHFVSTASKTAVETVRVRYAGPVVSHPITHK
jgi:hypothetical protein